jgi:APA family basic amino acid/polyamine antiporter
VSAAPTPAAARAGALRRVLGVPFGIAVVIGGVVGQGILRSPGIVAGAAPQPLWILGLWLAGGVLAAVSALPLVELGSSVPRSGGPYALAARAFGPVAGPAVGALDWLNSVLVISYLSVVFAEFVHRAGLGTGLAERTVAVLLIAAVTAVNWTGTRTSGTSQEIGSALKGVGLVILVGVLFAGGREAPAGDGAPAAVPTLAALAMALRVIQATYSGWNAPVYFGEEIRSAGSGIARAVFLGIASVTGLYLLVNAALLGVLSPAEIARSTLPVADAARRVLGERADLAVTWLSIVSLAAVANLYPMSASRIGYAMARDGALPSVLARVSPSGTPRVALVAATGTACAFACLGGYERLIAIASPVGLIGDLLMCLGAWRLRHTEPDLPRPFTMPLFPWPAVFGALLNGALCAAVIWEDPGNSVIGLALLAAVGVAYLARRTIARPA